MNALAVVLAGHFIGDWIAQTDYQAATKVWPPPDMLDAAILHAFRVPARVALDEPRQAKIRAARRQSWKANQQHMLSYHLILGPLAALVMAWPWVIATVVVSWLTHSVIDRRWPVKWLMRHTGSGPFSQTTFGVIAVDQALHLSILCLMVSAVR